MYRNYYFLLLFPWVSLAQSVESRFLPPPKARRLLAEVGSFGAFLQKFPLLPPQTPVRYFDGRTKPNQIQVAVLDIDRGTRDLQQCADAVMRLWAEYLYSQKRSQEIGFHNFAGVLMDWKRYARGFRMTARGYLLVARADSSRRAFRAYLDMVFQYANTFTLEKELSPRPLQQIQPGDVFIVSNPKTYGHAMLVMDMAEDTITKERYFLLAQSYMPAQDIHIVQNSRWLAGGGWYRVADIAPELHTPEWVFRGETLRHFN
jgi:Domain of unknown function (4846)